MIHIIRVICSTCHEPDLIVINDNQLIKIPYICPECFSDKESNKIRSKKIKIGYGGEIKEITFFLGYQRNKEDYKPIVLKDNVNWISPLNYLFSEN